MKKLLLTTLTSCLLALTFTLPVCAKPVEVEEGVIFDAEYYAEKNPDVAADLGSDEAVLYQHYKMFGINEGRQPYAPTAATPVITPATPAVKEVKTVTTTQPFDEEMIKYQNDYEGYERWVRYGIYSDATIDFELNAFNAYRRSKGLPELKVNEDLCEAAAMLALECEVGAPYIVDDAIANDRRPNGSYYTTVYKDCGITGVKSSGFLFYGYSEKKKGFVETLTVDYYSEFADYIDSTEYNEFGIGYYSTSDGANQQWIMIPAKR